MTEPVKFKRKESSPDDAWIRECQECGYLQEDKQPDSGKEPSLAYQFKKCRKCKSEALDYGTLNTSYDWTEDA